MMTSTKDLMQSVLIACIGVYLAEARLAAPTLGEAGTISRDPCVNFRCYNGGTCVAPDDLPRCSCAPGYTGRRCETRIGVISRDPCVNFRCYNGGTCVAPDDLPRCSCSPGYTGRRCETRIDQAQCGPCPNGWTCRFAADVVCVRAPCLAFTCVPPVVTEPCGGCPRGKTCRMMYPPCPAPPVGCDTNGGGLLARVRRSIPCPDYRCDPVPVCM